MLKRHFTTALALVAILMAATAQTTVTTHWPLDQDVRGMDADGDAIKKATAATISSDTPAYNLAGQRVDKAFKGVVIVNGKKMVRK